MLHSGITCGTFMVKEGVTIDRILTEKMGKINGKKVTIKEAVNEKKFAKVYIKLGLNELGWGYPEKFIEKYTELIQTIKNANPDSIIYVQSIIHVTKTESDESEIFNNNKVNYFNKLILEMVKEQGVYYVDLNEIFSDEDGALQADAANDGIHMKASYCKMWYEYLKKHTV